MEYRSLNPTTGELLETFDTTTDEQLEQALVRASVGFRRWRGSSLGERHNLLVAMAERLEHDASPLAELMAQEMGKPLAEGEAEAKKCAWVCRYYAEQAEAILTPRSHQSDGSEAYVRFDPIGPILAIMPWNFPLWQVVRVMAPALTAGNVVLLKHAPCVPRSAKAIASLMDAISTPEGLFQNLFLTNDQAARVIADPRVRGVSLTGSSRAGKQVGGTAGAHLKTMVMELGGSDPFIVFEDADLNGAAAAGVFSRCLNSGQSCIAAKRFLVQEDVLEGFSARFIEEMSKQVVGDPMDRAVTLGPLAREDLRETLARQVAESIEAGAKIVFQGTIPDGNGFFYPPTVLTDAAEGSPARDQELFGPVAVFIPFESEEQALEIANRTAYGLGASVWTEDAKRSKRLIAGIDAGSVFVNGLVKSDPRLPFGGVKESGFGRELSHDGLLEFVNRKTVWIR